MNCSKCEYVSECIDEKYCLFEMTNNIKDKSKRKNKKQKKMKKEK